MLRRVLVAAAIVGGSIVAGAGTAFAATCNVTITSPAPDITVRADVTIAWTYSNASACSGAKVEVVKPATAGGGTVLLATVTAPASSTTWPTATAAFPDADGYTVRVTPTAGSGHSAGQARTATGIEVDNTAPTLTFVGLTPEPNEHGWLASATTAAWSCTDGATTTTVTQALTSEGANQSATAECSDAVGNVAQDTVPGIDIDLTPPAIALSSRTPANDAGWNNHDVTVVWACSDALSGALDETVSVTLQDDGSDQTASGTCSDLAGNTAGDSHEGIHIDQTLPTIELSDRTPANDAGWNDGSVTVTWACSDALSGVTSDTASMTIGTEGADQAASGACIDAAGNWTVGTESGINIDTTAPEIALEDRTPANDAGWNDGSVTVAWACTDALSGPQAASVATTVSTEGAGQSATGVCADLAGNTAEDTQDGINIDTTAPDIALEDRTPANDAGWNADDVTVTWSCADALSGVAPWVSSTVSTEGADQVASGSCTDLAGNSASASEGGINIDRTAGSAVVAPSLLAARALGPSASGTADDALSGVAAIEVTFTDALGTTTTVDATCSAGCGTPAATWHVAFDGVAGAYSVSAVTVDVAGNRSGPSASESIIIA